MKYRDQCYLHINEEDYEANYIYGTVLLLIFLSMNWYIKFYYREVLDLKYKRIVICNTVVPRLTSPRLTSSNIYVIWPG